MSDIVDRLRYPSTSLATVKKDCAEAADEIERLRKINLKLDEIIERIKKLGI